MQVSIPELREDIEKEFRLVQSQKALLDPLRQILLIRFPCISFINQKNHTEIMDVPDYSPDRLVYSTRCLL